MNKAELINSLEKTLRQVLLECRIPVPPGAAVNWVVYGKNGLLNSLQLVQFIVDIEEVLLQQNGKHLVLTSEKALSHHQSPFRNLEALSDMILENYR